MRKRNQEAMYKTSAPLFEQQKARKLVAPKIQGSAAAQNAQLAQMICSTGDRSCMRKHESFLNTNRVAEPSYPLGSLYHLQQRYGNYYVQRVVALNHQFKKDTSGIQREEAGAGAQTTCSVTAKRETTRPRFCINGTTNAPNQTSVQFHYLPGLDNCSIGDLRSIPPFATATVMAGRFSWIGTSMLSSVPGVGRMMGAIVGTDSNAIACCTRVRPGRC